MMDLTPRQPHRPLIWPDFVFDLRDFLLETVPEIYVVGGAVRDAMLHRPLHDIDLAVPVDAVKVARKIANHFKGDIYVLDADRDIGRVFLTLPDERISLDVARFRGAALLDDLLDRDFTVNAMAVDLLQNPNDIIDPLNGESDLQVKRLRRSNEHALSHDPLRTVRAVRQSIQFGLHIEAQTLDDVRQITPQLAACSPERVRDEWFKLLDLPRPAAALRVAHSVGLVDAVMPECAGLQGISEPILPNRNAWQHTLAVIENMTTILNTISYSRTDQTAAVFSMGMMVMELDRFRSALAQRMSLFWPNERSHRALLMMGVLQHDLGRVSGNPPDEPSNLATIINRSDALRLSTPEKEFLLTLYRFQRLPERLPDTSSLSLYQFWKQTGEAGIDVCLLFMADYLASYGPHLRQDDWLKIIERVGSMLDAWFNRRQQVVSPPALLDGNRLIREFGLKPGPLIGDLLEQIRVAQVTEQVHSLDEALQFAANWLRSRT